MACFHFKFIFKWFNRSLCAASDVPETSFTRSISNPEVVMRRRREQKLEKRLQQFRSRDGGPDSGGTLKIYGESLSPDVPYKTLLLSVHDNAAHVVKDMLDKYGIQEDASNFCLVQVGILFWANTHWQLMQCGNSNRYQLFHACFREQKVRLIY